jgi:hypothetical protein
MIFCMPVLNACVDYVLLFSFCCFSDDCFFVVFLFKKACNLLGWNQINLNLNFQLKTFFYQFLLASETMSLTIRSLHVNCLLDILEKEIVCLSFAPLGFNKSMLIVKSIFFHFFFFVGAVSSPPFCSACIAILCVCVRV